MPWENWKSSKTPRRLRWSVCSLAWLSLCLVAARNLDLSVPYLPLAIAGGFIFYLRNWPKLSEQIAWVIASFGFSLIVRFPHNGWINIGSGVLSLFGFGAFLMLGCRWIWSQAVERRKTYAVLAPAAALVLFVLSAQRALNLANLLYPKTYDLYLYVFDGAFGFQPSFLAGRAMAASSLLRVLATLTYVSLPFVMALVYALRLPKNAERPSWELITLFLLAGLGGWALYNIVPATGPRFVFAADFPSHALPYPMLSKLFLEPIPLSSDIPRNAIPSLHMAWVVLLCWNAKDLSKKIRVFLGIYAALTVLSTIGSGEHYFVDLVAALPFALFVQCVVAPGVKSMLNRRIASAASGLALTLIWLLLVRYAAKTMLVSPLLPWTLAFATSAAVWRMKLWFEASPTIAAPAEFHEPTPRAMAAHAGQ